MSALIDRKAPVRPNGQTDPRNGPKPGLTRQPTAEERRRAQRVLLRMPVVLHIPGKPSMNGFTHTVNAKGSLVPVEFATPSPHFWNVFFPPAVN
jgi:hypothetical protein